MTRWTEEDIKKLKPGMVKEGVQKTFSFNQRKNFQALGRLKSGEMNKTEIAYSERLETLKSLGEIQWYCFEPMSLKLGERCTYRVDFMVLTKEGYLEVHEVKGGFITDDALVKIKAAAAKFPFKFIMCIYKKNAWTYREF